MSDPSGQMYPPIVLAAGDRVVFGVPTCPDLPNRAFVYDANGVLQRIYTYVDGSWIGEDQ